MTPIDMLGWTGSALVVLSLTQGNLRRLRTINLAASGIHLAFNLVLGLMPMIALNAVLTGINGYYLMSERHKKTKPPTPALPPAAEEERVRDQANLPMVDGFQRV